MDPQQSFPKLEEGVLERWRERDVFERSVKQREGAQSWVFWEGPPTANGRPGVHHVLSRVFKDIFPRFQTMRGRYVERRGGWDCHGLPVEIAVEKQLGLHSKHDIESIVPGDVRASIEQFNAACRASVFEFLEDWDKLTQRIGFWVDLDDAYRTMDTSYVESVWEALKTMHGRGLLYQGNKVVPFCTRCGTALSSHEVAQGYKDIKDTSAYVRLPIAFEGEVATPADGPLQPGDSLVVWTTTPWTLVANVAAAVHPDVEYVRVQPLTEGEGDEDAALVPSGGPIVVAKPLIEATLGPDFLKKGGFEILGEPFTGDQLVGTVYAAPFVSEGRLAGGRGAVLAAEFVTTDSGTGIVHLAPAFGQDDFTAVADAAAAGTLPPGLDASAFDPRDPSTLLHPVSEDGTYTPAATSIAPGTELAGRFVKDLDIDLVKDLAARGLLLRSQRYEHSYPHCWRCDTALLYYARPSWYLATAKLRDNLLSANDDIAWHPPHIRDGRFGEWLRGNVDWAISRERYWGTPLPIWRSTDHPDGEEPRMVVVGSLAELAELSGTKLDDPHRPFVDDVTFTGEDGLTYARVPEVIDVWFDSGAMPFAQDAAPHDAAGTAHYEAHRQADFICEAIDQTRGWFYSLLAVSVLLRDEAPYKNVVCLGHIRDEHDQKMSKSRGNIVAPWDPIDRFGADALRWYFFTSKQPWDGYRYSDEAVRDGVRLFLLPLWNTASFYAQYAGIAAEAAARGEDAGRVAASPSEQTELDRWITSRVEAVTELVTERLEDYDVTAAGRAIGELVDELSNWYVRRSRRRFWDGDPVALETLRDALLRISTLLAPFTPFVADELFEQLGGDEDSVHLADWPQIHPGRRDLALEADMATARETVRLGLAARAASGINLRQPLHAAVVVATGKERDAIERLAEVIREELNVKELRFVAEADELGKVLLKPNLRALGPKFGKAMSQARAAIEALDGSAVAAALRAGEPVTLSIDGNDHAITEDDLLMSLEAPEGYQLEREGQHAVALELEIDDALRAEGRARAVLRQIQVARQGAGLDVTDRITLTLDGDPVLLDAVRAHEAYVTGETLAEAVSYGTRGGTVSEAEIEQLPIAIGVAAR
ncbi:MAG: isoleucine--tRNA ligase [Solirubrobacteraceae bacterium]|nr:isoleucine--tRNA ligase [Solirubrobacteraceae bacterium]